MSTLLLHSADFLVQDADRFIRGGALYAEDGVIREVLRKTVHYSVSGAEISFGETGQAHPAMYFSQVRKGKRVVIKKVSTR
jgi:hypothetical protein